MNHLDFSAYSALSLIDFPESGFKLERWQKLLNTLAEIFDAPNAMINQANTKGIEVLVSNQHKQNPYVAGGVVPLDCNIYCHHVVQKRHALYVQDAREEGGWDDNPELANDNFCSYFGLPLEWPDGRIFGTLCVMSRKASDYSDSQRELIQSYKEVIDFELALLEQNRHLKSISVLDELTGLLNRRGVEEAAQQLASMAARVSQQLAVFYIDMDKLKPLNDTYGHQAGDQAIKLLARSLRSISRQYDLVGRLGGDEFVLIAMVKNENDSSVITRRLHQALTNAPLSLPDDKQQRLDVSIGIEIGVPADKDALLALIADADKQMYRAKQAKRSAE
ncbi:diguanylate cyclase [Corallincola platygyrae]|uniref:diguanylate cyclase n=1 Tax=Corallincola platygyrae TaxID=1193278 RepID=A0ABW4XHU0_9GAMM